MSQKPERFTSLDVFRGMTICFMIIVNTPGSGAESFAPLHHAHWFGFTPTDLVFPSFMFAVGTAMSFSIKKLEGLNHSTFILKIFKRAAVIFLLGYLMYWFPFVNHNAATGWSLKPITHTRIMGVLQRIALGYFFASLMIRFLSIRGVITSSLFLLFGYWFILLIWGDATDPYGMLTNAGTYLDKFILGDNHLHHGEGVAFDPEGILSTLPSIVNVTIGYLAGRFIQQKGKSYETIAKLMLWGSLLIFAALCWNLTFPIAKKLWSSPFVLLTVGIDLLIISLLIYLIEIREGKTAWKGFFITVGKNPLMVYLFSELFVTVLYLIPVKGTSAYEWINNVFFQAILPGALGSLLFAICYMLVCWCVGKVLEKTGTYVRA
jgi:predicted acyltransferase